MSGLRRSSSGPREELAMGPGHRAVHTWQDPVGSWGVWGGASAPPTIPLPPPLPNQPTCQPGGSKEPGLRHTQPLGPGTDTSCCPQKRPRHTPLREVGRLGRPDSLLPNLPTLGQWRPGTGASWQRQTAESLMTGTQAALDICHLSLLPSTSCPAS